MFAELHCHTDMGSNTRLTDTTNKVDATIRHAVSMGLRGLAITDHEALCAHIKALNHQEDQNKAGRPRLYFDSRQ